MIGTPAIRNLIRENKVAQMYSAIQTGQNSACRRWTRICRPGAAQRRLCRSARGAQQGANKDAFPARPA
jgi:twitching motility protein PilT